MSFGQRGLDRGGFGRDVDAASIQMTTISMLANLDRIKTLLKRIVILCAWKGIPNVKGTKISVTKRTQLELWYLRAELSLIAWYYSSTPDVYAGQQIQDNAIRRLRSSIRIPQAAEIK